MAVGAVAYVCTYMVGFLLNLVAMFIIQKYLQDKPTGMQTLLDKVTMTFTKVLSALAFVSSTTLSIGQGVAPMTKLQAQISEMANFAMVSAFRISFTFLMLTKYFSIYHGSMLVEVNEELLLKVQNGLLVTLPIIFSIIEFTMLSDFEELSFYHLFIGSDDLTGTRLERLASVQEVIMVMTILVLRIRIEYDAILANDVQVGLLGRPLAWMKKMMKNDQIEKFAGESQTKTNEETVRKVPKTVIFCSLLCIAVFVYQAGVGADNMKWNTMLLYQLIAVVIPFIFIFKHHGMSAVAQKLLKTIIPVKSSSIHPET